MPRQTQIKKNRRPQVNAQDTFDYTSRDIEVSRNPVHVDRYQRESRPLKGQQLAQALDDITGAMLKGSKLYKEWTQEQERRGALAQFLGVEESDIPEASADPFVRGREKFKGMASAEDFQVYMDNFLEKNRDLNPFEFDNELQKAKREFLKGRTKDFVEGILPEAVKIEDKINRNYTQYRVDLFKNDFWNDNRKWARYQFNDLRQSYDQELADESISDKEARQRYAEGLHAKVKDLQELGVNALGVSRNDVNKEVVDMIGREAVRSGRPDLLFFALVEDSSGIRIIDTEVGKDVESYLDQARKKATDMESQRLKAIEAKRGDMEDSVARAVVEALDTGKWDEAEQLLIDFGQPGRNEFGVALTPEKLKQYRGALRDLRNDSGFARGDGDTRTWEELYNAAKAGDLTIERLRANQHRLGRGKYEEIFKAMITEREQAKKASGGGGMSEMQKFLKSAVTRKRSDMNSLTNPTGDFGKLLDQVKGPMRATRAEFYLNQKVTEYMRENEGVYPPLEELEKFGDYAVHKAYEDFKWTIGAQPPSIPPDPFAKPKVKAPAEGTETPAPLIKNGDWDDLQF